MLIGFAIIMIVYIKYIKINEKFTDTDKVSLVTKNQIISLSNNTIVRPTDIMIYLNVFNITNIDPRNTITIAYSFNNYSVADLVTFKSTGIESVISNILNNVISVVAVNVIDDINNNILVIFNISYNQLSESTAALLNINDTLQLPGNAALIYAALNGCTSFTLIGKPIQGDASQINTTYLCNPNTWCDSINSNIKFNIKGQNIPLSITTDAGFRMNNIQLYGPESDSLSSSINNYILGPFTCAFFMKINSLTINGGNSIILFQLFAETPNMIRFAIYYQDPNNSIVEAIIGNLNTKYTWVIPNSTLMSNGYTTLYTFQYDPANSICNFYIGNTLYIANLELNPDEPIILSVTSLTINKGLQTIDAQLYAFIYYNSLLSLNEITSLTKYFQYELGGISILQNNNLQSISQIQQLQSSIQQNKNNIQKSNSCVPPPIVCEAAASASASGSITTNIQNPWVVNYNAQIDSNLESQLSECSPLQIKKSF